MRSIASFTTTWKILLVGTPAPLGNFYPLAPYPPGISIDHPWGGGGGGIWLFSGITHLKVFINEPSFQTNFVVANKKSESVPKNNLIAFQNEAGGKNSYSIVLQEESYEPSEDAVEMDELNSHECMAKMTALLKHLQQNKISPEPPKVWNPPYIVLGYCNAVIKQQYQIGITGAPNDGFLLHTLKTLFSAIQSTFRSPEMHSKAAL